MFIKWPQNGNSRSSESSNISGEEFFLLRPLRKRDHLYTILNIDREFKTASLILEDKNSDLVIKISDKKYERRFDRSTVIFKLRFMK